MGIAAYNRGTRAISAHIDQTAKESRSVVERPPTPPPTAVIRVDENGVVWLLQRREKGWGEYGYWYASWAALRLAWNVTPVQQTDNTGIYWTV